MLTTMRFGPLFVGKCIKNIMYGP